jgi:hypothetical protein
MRRKLTLPLAATGLQAGARRGFAAHHASAWRGLMDRRKASDFPQELLDLFGGYVHGGISRRQFFDGAQKFAVGASPPRSCSAC